MRNFFLSIISCFLILNASGQVSIGAPVAHPSAELDVSSTTKGLLPPRMTAVQRDAISNPSPGLMIFNTTSQRLEIFASLGGWYGIQTEVQERKLLGGNFTEESPSIRQTSDGGFILAGSTFNDIPNGDFTDSNKRGTLIGNGSGTKDCWIVKLDGNRNISWSKVYGGVDDEIVSSIQQTVDGGYIVAGSSTSSSTGDIGVNKGLRDCWILKLTSSGVISWSKLYGGSANDEAIGIVESKGGYIFAAKSRSSANGDVQSTSKGFSDYWVVNIDLAGTIVWEHLFGGSGEDIPASLEKTTDGGYIIAGSSNSSASFDVTGTNHGGSGNLGVYSDYWILKLSGAGTKSWNKLLGGNGDDKATAIKQTTDGGYVVAGYSSTSANGDVTSANHGDIDSHYDCWIIKIDAKGIIGWNTLMGGSTAGGAPSNLATDIVQTTDGGYAVAAHTTASAVGNVTNVNHGESDYWIIKLDFRGYILWNKLFGGNKMDKAYSILQTADEGLVIAGDSFSSDNGNVNSLNHGYSDYWIIRLNSSGNFY